MSAETWRVIDENGAEHAATVDVRESAAATAISVAIGCLTYRDTYHRATPIRAAIAHRAWAGDVAVAEILAPGQPSRAEVEADAFRRGAEAMREMAACDIAGWWQIFASEAATAATRIRALPLPEVAK